MKITQHLRIIFVLLFLIACNCYAISKAKAVTEFSLESQYFAALMSHIQPHWELHKNVEFESNLAVILTLTIDKSGNIKKLLLSESSNNFDFDSVAIQSVNDAEPFPPIPMEMKKDEIEIGLRFKPGSIR